MGRNKGSYICIFLHLRSGGPFAVPVGYSCVVFYAMNCAGLRYYLGACLGNAWLTVSHQVFPVSRRSHSVGPGIEVREDPLEKRRRELDGITSLE